MTCHRQPDQRSANRRKNRNSFQRNIGFVRIQQHCIPNVAGFIDAVAHLRTHADYAAQVAIVGDHLCTLSLPYQEMSYARKERHAGIWPTR